MRVDKGWGWPYNEGMNRRDHLAKEAKGYDHDGSAKCVGRCLLLALALGLVSCVGPDKHVGILPGLIVERLQWMDEVAMVKQAKGLPIEDEIREAAVLDAMEGLGREAGLPGGVVREFFVGQMEAAKALQREWFRSNPKGEKLAEPLPNLNSSVRPALDQIGRQMIEALVDARENGEPAELIRATRRRMNQESYSRSVTGSAIKGLRAGLH